MDPSSIPPRFSQRQHTSDTQFHALGQNRNRLEFTTPEDLLRHDAAATTPPEGLEPRLQNSIRAEPAPKRAWWNRWFGRSTG
jgi:hypothetical protein